MKRGTDLKIKFAELRAKLSLEPWATKGVLQSIWDFTAENAMHGDIGRFTDEQIAIGIGWPVEQASALVEALTTTRWLDSCRNHRLVVHDWQEHCEEWIRKRVKRSGKQFVTPNRRTTAAARRKTSANGSLPLPLPGPDPGPEPDPNWARIWSKYPKRAGGNPEDPAFESWTARLREGESAEELESAVIRYHAFCSATGKIGTEYVMQGAAFFGPKRRGYKQDWTIPEEMNGKGRTDTARPATRADWDAEAERHAAHRDH